MRKRNALDHNASVFVDSLMLSCVNSMELNLILKTVIEKLHLLIEQRLQLFRGVNLQWCRTPKHPKG